MKSINCPYGDRKKYIYQCFYVPVQNFCIPLRNFAFPLSQIVSEYIYFIRAILRDLYFP